MTKAGRIPFEFEQLLPYQPPLEFTIKAFCEPLIPGAPQPVASQLQSLLFGINFAYILASSSVRGAALTSSFP